MKKQVYLFSLLILLVCFSFYKADAQSTRYIIQFKNKATNPYSIATPSNYLSPKAIARRNNYSIAIDSFDLPITPRYIDSIRLSGTVTILNKSKWLNSITIQTTDATALSKINAFSFVASTTGIAARTTNANNQKPTDKFEMEKITSKENMVQRVTSTQDYFNYGNTYNEIKIHNGQFLHNIGLRGQGMLVAVLDAGFYQYTTLSSFDSVNANNQVLQTWDFVSNHSSVIEDAVHGMSCFSTIAGNIPGTFVGNAPKANFVLYRTEDDATEYPIEEFNWISGLEKADSIGADICSTSLGYTTFDNNSFDHTYAQMNGKTTIAAKGGVYAHRKGMLLFTAMGNDGTNSWKYLSTPADIDSTISVGAVNTSGIAASFSSYGPAYDGRVKPEASAVGAGAYVQTAANTIAPGNGTSYATPKMAGLGTCLKQGFPEFNNYVVRDAIIQSGSIYTAPNDRIGYGIPDMKKAFVLLLNKYAKITSSSITNCKTTLNWQSKDGSSMKYEIERLIPTQTTYTKVGEVQGSAALLANHTYTFSDTLINVQVGNIKYRIKQIVDTATSSFYATYFDSVSISLNASCVPTSIAPINNANTNIVLLPNPVTFSSILKIVSTDAIKNLNIRLLNIDGKIIANIATNKLSGTKTITLPTNHLAKGVYLIQVFNDKNLLQSLRLVRL